MNANIENGRALSEARTSAAGNYSAEGCAMAAVTMSAAGVNAANVKWNTEGGGQAREFLKVAASPEEIIAAVRICTFGQQGMSPETKKFMEAALVRQIAAMAGLRSDEPRCASER